MSVLDRAPKYGILKVEVKYRQVHINLNLQKTAKNSSFQAGFELAFSGLWPAALPVELYGAKWDW